MKRYILFCLVIVTFAVGCAPRYPVTKVNSIDSRPTLSFENAPRDAVVLVDGLSMGSVSKYDGKPNVLIVEPGTHEITIMENNVVVLKQAVFVESEHKVIKVH